MRVPRPPVAKATLLLIALLAPLAARADITGFSDISNFTVNQADGGSSATLSGGTLELTNNAVQENRSVFYNTPQSVSQFTASFTYQATPMTGVPWAAFVVQNSPQGASATGYPGMADSVAITLEPGNGQGASGVYNNGGGGGATPTTPVNLFSGDPINVNVTYSSGQLTEVLTDATTGATFNDTFLVNIPTVIGSTTAYVGITAITGFGDGDPGGQNQYFSNFQFTPGVSTPEPSSVALFAIGAVALLAYAARQRHRMLTSAIANG